MGLRDLHTFILQLNKGLYANRTETSLPLHFMKVSDIMNVILCSEGKRYWNSKESAQEVLLQVYRPGIGLLYATLHWLKQKQREKAVELHYSVSEGIVFTSLNLKIMEWIFLLIYFCVQNHSVKTLCVPVRIERSDHLELKLQPW